MAKIYYENHADLNRLKGKKVAVIGYGSQGRAHALNLHDSGVEVVVGLYEGSKSRAKAEADGLTVKSVSDAAKEADVVSLMPRSRADGSGLDTADATEQAFGVKVAWIKEAAGDRFSTLELNTLVQAVTVTSDRDAAARTLSANWKQPADQLLVSPLVLIGGVEEVASTLERRREQLGISSITVFEKDLDGFAQVIERIAR